jgi:hypothetical protein
MDLIKFLGKNQAEDDLFSDNENAPDIKNFPIIEV